MKPDKVLSMIGIAARGGNVQSGEFSAEKAIKAGRLIWQLLQRMRRRILKSISGICVPTGISRMWNMRIKTSLAIALEKNTGHRWQLQMNIWQRQL